MRLGFALCLVVGCGSSGTKTHQIDDPAAAKRDVSAQQPESGSVYELHDREVYQPTGRCGQGPYRIETTSPPSKFGEELVVYACADHNFVGNYRMTSYDNLGGKPYSNESPFGYGDLDNAACKAKDVTSATDSANTGNGRGTGGGRRAANGVTAASPKTLQSTTLEAGATLPQDCSHVGIIDQPYSTTLGYDPYQGHWVIDIWSDEPNDLEGLVFVVEHNVVRSDMSVERWKAYNDKKGEALRAAWEHASDEEIRAAMDVHAKTPPPPAPRAEKQPPQPSRNARWIPGYWLYADTKFHWISGLWDVPDEDIQKQLTVQTPTPPPAAPKKKEEPTEAAPTTTAVWAPGSWQWDGRAYIWVAGAWRIPPDEHHTWQPAGWTIHTGVSVYVPGGWRIRIGR